GSPGSAVLRDAATPCRPFRRTSFPSFGDTTVSSPIRPHRLGTGAVDQPGVVKPGSNPAVNDGDGKVSQVPVRPVAHSPCSSDPGVTRHAGGSKCRYA